jgi:pimeloyl-ACP methyl ester carboxylesterase
VLWGAADRLFAPRYAEAWRTTLPHAEAEIIDGAGHALGLERPDVTAERIARFLGR